MLGNKMDKNKLHKSRRKEWSLGVEDSFLNLHLKIAMHDVQMPKNNRILWLSINQSALSWFQRIKYCLLAPNCLMENIKQKDSFIICHVYILCKLYTLSLSILFSLSLMFPSFGILCIWILILFLIAWILERRIITRCFCCFYGEAIVQDNHVKRLSHCNDIIWRLGVVSSIHLST